MSSSRVVLQQALPSHNIVVIITQYGNWKDTILCLESVLHSYCPPRWIIVVDNCSPNDAASKITSWATGEYEPPLEHPQLLPFHVKKPYPLYIVSPEEACSFVSKKDNALSAVFLVKNTVNRGYAGGNNIGLRIGLAVGAEAFWILNNDTMVEPGTLEALYKRLCSCAKPGLVGGMVCYLSAPSILQCRAGGYTNPWLFLSSLNGHTLKVDDALQTPVEEVEKNLNFIYGASIMASRNFVKTVGFMDERLFLYCEEQDWAWTNAGRFDLAYAPAARIYHKEGGSTGLSRMRRPWRRLLLIARNKLLVTYKHKTVALPLVCFGIIFAFFRIFVRTLVHKLSPKTL